MKTEPIVFKLNPRIFIPDRLVLVRHAESIGNPLTSDDRAKHALPNYAYPLTPEGTRQAESAGKILGAMFRSNQFGMAFKSTFRRTADTLDILLKESKLRINVFEDSRLDEKLDGIFHEMTEAQIKDRYPDQIEIRRRSGYYHFRAPGGENCSDVEMRIRSFFADVYMMNCQRVDTTMLICCHGNWLLLFRRLVC